MSEGTLHAVDCEPIEFANDFFIKGKMDLIQKIKRKDAKPRTPTNHVRHIQPRTQKIANSRGFKPWV